MTIEYVDRLDEDYEPTEDESMPNFEHGMICGRLIQYLRNHAAAHNLGEVLDSSPEYRVLKRPAGNSGKLPARFPDLSFVRRERLPRRLRSYPEIVPDLAVEVISPTDRDSELETKIMEYQQVGVPLVWIIHPVSRRVDVYTLAGGLRPVPYLGEDILPGDEILPGLALPVSDIFNYPPDPPEEGL